MTNVYEPRKQFAKLTYFDNSNSGARHFLVQYLQIFLVVTFEPTKTWQAYQYLAMILDYIKERKFGFMSEMSETAFQKSLQFVHNF